MLRTLGRLLILYGCWIGMMTVHELGHVIGTWASGGEVERVVVSFVGFSRTDVRINPHPLVEVWAGPVLGWVIPYGTVIAMRAARRRVSSLMQFFAGMCGVVNGAYIGAGVFMPVGDARVMKGLGTPVWVMGLFGVVAMAAGLWEWHLLGKKNVPPARGYAH